MLTFRDSFNFAQLMRYLGGKMDENLPTNYANIENSNASQIPQVYVVHMGRRGGGASFHRDFTDALRFKYPGLVSVISSRNELVSEKSADYIIDAGSSGNIFLEFIHSLKAFNRFVKEVAKIQKSPVFIISMVHPLDVVLYRRKNRSNLRIFAVIHDGEKHPGELFPPRIFLRLIKRHSDGFLFLSKYVSNQFKTSKTSCIMNFPKNAFSNQKSDNPPFIDILFLGRFKKYKGISLFEDTLRYIPRDYKIVVAGENAPKLAGTSEISRWMSEEEMSLLIKNSRLVVCPYISATQSGILNFSHQLGTPVVVTPVGGLPEQVDETNGRIANSRHPKDIWHAIEKCLNWNFENVRPRSLGLEPEEAVFKLLSN